MRDKGNKSFKEIYNMSSQYFLHIANNAGKQYREIGAKEIL